MTEEHKQETQTTPRVTRERRQNSEQRVQVAMNRQVYC